MAKATVSDDFKKYRSRAQSSIAEAKKAENTMQTCKMPVGWTGQAVCTGGFADKGKDRKGNDGKTVEGRPYVLLELEVINDPEYAGAKFSHAWSFWDTEKATAGDRYTWMLNEMENLGLPRETRETYEDEAELINFFIESDQVFEATVEHNEYRRGDQKEVKIHLGEDVDNTDDINPDAGPSEAPTSDGTLEVDSEVKYMGKLWDVVDVDGEDISIKSKATGNTRTIKATMIEN